MTTTAIPTPSAGWMDEAHDPIPCVTCSAGVQVEKSALDFWVAELDPNRLCFGTWEHGWQDCEEGHMPDTEVGGVIVSYTVNGRCVGYDGALSFQFEWKHYCEAGQCEVRLHYRRGLEIQRIAVFPMTSGPGWATLTVPDGFRL
jgi:hypothetical protein